MNEPSIADDLAESLLRFLGQFDGVAIAFSGGVDSAVVACAAAKAQPLGRALALTAVSPSVPQYQQQLATQTAQQIGIEHQFVPTAEVNDPRYQANDGSRCYWCKQSLYSTLRPKLAERNLAVLVSGTNLDDLGDYRPGLKAGSEAGVVCPLVELGITKQGVRQLAKQWALDVWDLPASPCLASRIAYGVEVTPERLARVEAAEAFLRGFGIPQFRVRCHADELARIEVPADEIPRLCSDETRQALSKALRDLGFKYISIDLEGFRSGNLNEVIQISTRSK